MQLKSPDAVWQPPANRVRRPATPPKPRTAFDDARIEAAERKRVRKGEKLASAWTGARL